MVDATQAAESSYITAELIKASPTKIVVPIDAGKYEVGNFGEKLTIGVEIDKKPKKWSPNISSAKEIIAVLGTDTKKWLGKEISLQVVDDRVQVILVKP